MKETTLLSPDTPFPADALLERVNHTERSFPAHQTIQELFEERVDQHPERVAVLFGADAFTYRQLNEQANRVAWTLRKAGVGTNQVVGIMVERSFEMMIGVLGILKAGAAYLPISPADPAKRIEYILSDSQATVLLVQRKWQDKVAFAGQVIALDAADASAAPGHNPPALSGPADLAYVLYTSGSTGKPKGVMIEHRSVVNRLKWMQRQYPIGEADTLLQKTSFSFDVSVWELFWWALEGAKVALLRPGGEKIPLLIVEAIHTHRVSVIHFVPAMLNAFLDYIDDAESLAKLAGLKRVFASGEALLPGHVRKFNRTLHQHHQTQLTNLYGPTEATVDATYYDCPPGVDLKKVPIGKPIDNMKVCITGKTGECLPVGEPGELCLAGVGLARGYLNKEALTREKFVPHPGVPGQCLYRTGDLAQWMPDGNIEFLGRIDYQVKIRGLRIELPEIEAVLLAHPAVSECVVVTREQSGEITWIVAYVVARGEVTTDDLKTYARQFLPEYMIPNLFIHMELLPLNQNGKVDRAALPTPGIEMPKIAVAAHETSRAKGTRPVDRTLPFTKEELDAIIDKFPPPFHIYDERRLIDTARRLKKAFAWHPGFKQFFAFKATPNPNILRVLMNEGLGADCSSLAELMLSERCGLQGEKIMFSANVPPSAEFQKARQLEAIINLDDLSHIAFLEKVAGLPEIISLRYNPGDIRQGNVFLGTLCEAKFGFTKEQLFEGYRTLKAKGVKRFGLHTMVATQMLDPMFFVHNTQMLLELALELERALHITIEFINLGGGIGIPYRPHEEAVDLDFVGEEIRKVYQQLIADKGHPPVNIYTECGRMMTGPSGYMVARVIHRKSTYKEYVGLEASMANLMRIGMYGEYHHITVMGKEDRPADHTYDIIGSLCENNDKFAINRNLPRIDIGDILVIHDTGAHGYAMGFNYNGKLRSGELLLRPNKEVIQIRRPETLEDYFATLQYVM